jgi:predicted transcriptional regulator
MDVLELRADLHNMIDKISDSSVLQAVKTLLSNQKASPVDWWETIDESEKAEIELGLKQIEDGEVIPHEEVMEKNFITK